MAKSNRAKGAEIYRRLYALNAGFAKAAHQCRRLQEEGLFKSKATKLFPSFIEELRCEINSEFLNRLRSAEMADWARHGKVRQKWDKYLKGSEPKQQKR